MQKVVVFVDYESTYRGARRAFFKETDPPTLGHIDPLKLGQFIATDNRRSGFLYQMRVYRGLPDPEKDPVGHAAAGRRAEVSSSPR